MKKVVSATLAGALAVGMVPAMALADDAVELQASGEEDLIASAEIYSLEGGLADGHEFTKGDPNGTVLVIDKIYVTETKEYIDADSTVYHKVNADGTIGAAVANPSSVGKYAAFAMVGAVKTDKYVTFTIAGASLEGIELYEIDADKKADLSDESFIFTNEALKLGNASNAGAADGWLGLKLGGKAINVADFTAVVYDDEYKVVKASFSPAAAGTSLGTLKAGDYILELKPKKNSNFEGEDPFEIEFTIGAVDLASATIVLNDADGIVQAGADYPTALKINGVDASNYSGLFEYAYSAAKTTTGKQYITVKATTAGGAFADSFYGQGKAEYLVVDHVVALETEYDGVEITDAKYGTEANAYEVDRTAKKFEEFNPAEIDNVKAGSIDFEDAYTVSYFKKVDPSVNPLGWVASSLEEVQNPNVYGMFKVVVSVNTTVGEDTYAGTDVMYVQTVNAAVESSDVAFVYAPNNSVLASNSLVTAPVAYDGTDVMEDIAITVKTDKGVVVPASEYSVVIKKADAKVPGKWDAVDKIVDQGDYKVYIESAKYAVEESYGINIKVVPAKCVPTFLSQIPNTTPKTFEVLYTGNEINPIVGFTNQGVDANKDTKDDAIEVPADAYKVAVTAYTAWTGYEQPALTPAAIKAPGTYTITVTDLKNGVNVDNYEMTVETSYTIIVNPSNVFIDVPSGKWFADEVYTMASKNIVKGYGAGVFGPYDNADREDVALMLFRVCNPAARVAAADGVNPATPVVEYVTPFADVNGKAYYAQAVKWAYDNKVMGVGTGSLFGVDTDITRQEFVTALMRLDAAKLYTTGDTLLQASALDAYADADEVAAWAVEGMAWAVENGLMGVDTDYLNPTDNINRAELAAVLARYMELRSIA